jgi:hypothetical protein
MRNVESAVVNYFFPFFLATKECEQVAFDAHKAAKRELLHACGKEYISGT